MFIPDDDDVINSDEPARSGEPQTDRVNGEYHYKNGYTQKIYSDAHYVREEDNTVPPRYYTPPAKAARETKEARTVKEPRRGRAGAVAKSLCMCLVCALLGGLGGGVITASRMEGRIESLETSLEEVKAQTINQGSALTVISQEESSRLSPEQIYEMACRQVVGITTEVAYTNLFGMTSSSAVSGSGFLVTETGYIITNYHVIEYAYEDNREATVILYDGTRYPATVIGVEESNDIAVLKIDAPKLSAATLGDSDRLSVGETVYAVGNPLGELEFSMSTGYVSALDRAIKTEESSDSIHMFQIDAAVNSGNSGGPVYNAEGEVIGVVTAKYRDTGVEGIGFAIPINDAASISHDLITKGYVTGKAYMGVKLDERYNAMYSQYYGMPLGAYVYSVETGSCAEAAGLRAGDIITQLGDFEISGYEELRSAVKNFSSGNTVDLVVYRAGESLTLTITFDELKPESASDSPARLGPAD